MEQLAGAVKVDLTLWLGIDVSLMETDGPAAREEVGLRQGIRTQEVEPRQQWRDQRGLRA